MIIRPGFLASNRLRSAVEPAPEGAHRYWRLFITAVESGQQTFVRELRFKEDFADVAYMTGGTASASSVNASDAASRAFDGSDDTGTINNFWQSSATDLADGNAWIAYDFGAGNERPCVGIIITTTSSPNSTNPTNMKVQYSDDGSAWTDAWTIEASDLFGTQIFMDTSALTDRVTNGNFETGNKTGWTNGTNGSSQTVETATTGGDAPRVGTYLLDTGSSGTDPTTFQDIDLTAFLDTADIDAGDVRSILYGWGINWSTDNDVARLQWEWLDGTDTLIGSASTSGTFSQTWTQLRSALAGEVVPASARTLRLSLISVLTSGGTANVAHDDISAFFEVAA